MKRGTFNPRLVLMVALIGFGAFIALLYFLSAGDTGERANDGQAHAASPGLNGFAGLARLLELQGYDVELSRSASGFETENILVLTPPMGTQADDFAEILEGRQFRGPTVVILPKWNTLPFPGELPDEIEDKVQDGWVRLGSSQTPGWVADLPAPYAIKINREPARDIAANLPEVAEGQKDTENVPPKNWSGFGVRGQLPDAQQLVAEDSDLYDNVLSDSAGNAMVIDLWGEEGSSFYDEAQRVLYVVEPDLLNNYGLAREANARLADAIFQFAGYQQTKPVVFDLTLNGLGGTTNLLTLAFRPPFLAATLCLILALLIVGWRAFRRFGPPVAERPAIDFGKQRLVTNGAGLILRARRTGLLAAPYNALIAKRIQATLGLTRHDNEALDEAIFARMPDDPGFSKRADALEAASRPTEILRAARALHELERTLRT